jgi:epoxide hydrolase 4
MTEHLRIENGGVSLHAVTAGPVDGELVILLHGFPEFWFGWRRQIVALAAAGFRVVAPDQRGYNTSSKPAGVGAYAIGNLVSDVLAIADHMGRPKFRLAGHDWGAAVAWVTAAAHPERVTRLAILNVPHPATMMRFVRSDARQMRRSWYILLFQIPWLPEAGFSARDFRVGKNSLVRTSRPGTFSDRDLECYRDAWAQPGALTAMINWYRAFFRANWRGKMKPMRIEVPTRIFWGEKDAFLLPEMAGDSLKYCAHADVLRFPECTHWLHHEEPEKISEALIGFFADPGNIDDPDSGDRILHGGD